MGGAAAARPAYLELNDQVASARRLAALADVEAARLVEETVGVAAFLVAVDDRAGRGRDPDRVRIQPKARAAEEVQNPCPFVRGGDAEQRQNLLPRRHLRKRGRG